ncbi:thrombospondin type 3 repeat-containing protein, partial [Maribacter ulvicola]|uniref:thrombospondin type 3 repeat-containing protein n=1 Tax=Maribacter ulvicola TaxID=228959 RepID=UPI00117D01BB
MSIIFLLFFISEVKSQDPCTDGATAGIVTANDPDADGINNICDKDDDNDGVLDIEEGSCTSSLFSEMTFVNDQTFTGVLPSGTTYTAVLSGTNNRFNGVDGNNDQCVFSTSNYTGAETNTDHARTNIRANEPSGTLTITFSKSVSDLNFHLGGTDYSTWNFAPTPGISLIRLSGNADFSVVGTLVSDGNNANGVTAPDCNLANQIGSAYGTVQVQGTYTTIVINVSNITGNNDGQRLQIAESVCLTDTDNDGTPDYLDRDSDGDGCLDVFESGGVDVAPADGILDGTGFNSDGLVTGGTGGYNGVTGNEAEAIKVTISTPPSNQTFNDGDSTTFSVIATGDQATSYSAGNPVYGSTGNADSGLNYQWYNGNPDMGGTIIPGETGSSYSFNAALADDGNQYCVLITHDDNVCIREISCATLTLNPLDSDNDGISDGQEAIDGTDPNDDCDSVGGTPLGTSDCDNDGLTNDEETTGVDDLATTADPNGEITDPNDPDSDDDG